MQLVNRYTEQKRMKNVLTGANTVFVVVYGRRSCGKSTLLRQMMERDDVYFVADRTESKHQIALFAKAVADKIQGFDKVIYPNWTTFFENLNLRLPRRTNIFIDEFQYLLKSDPQLPEVIRIMLDNKANKRFNLIVCGSSQQLMSGLVSDTSSPLYGRTNEVFKIQPMEPSVLRQTFHCSAVEAIEEYSIWGGSPRYWDFRLREKSLDEALKNHVLSPQSALYDEPVKLLLDDMRDITQSFTILSLIASGCNRLSEIAETIGKPTTSLNAPLDKLLSLGHIYREVSFSENIKNPKKSLYKIADPFLRFYFTFVVPNRSQIETGRIEPVLNKIQQQLPACVASTWERFCRQTVASTKFNGIAFKPASKWWGSPKNPTGLDIVAESVDGNYLLIGDCQWGEKVYGTKNLFRELEEKIASFPFPNNRTVLPVLFLKETDKREKENNVYTPNDLLYG
ncbi:MAG: ATP-binding protein [Prevotellaceae bacterium]|jgi:AAA+ ATPase superfamily predicted ATPase|nr:ATP-binding protein [Prevotellaceae bacterium]